MRPKGLTVLGIIHIILSLILFLGIVGFFIQLLFPIENEILVIDIPIFIQLLIFSILFLISGIGFLKMDKRKGLFLGNLIIGLGICFFIYQIIFVEPLEILGNLNRLIYPLFLVLVLDFKYKRFFD